MAPISGQQPTVCTPTGMADSELLKLRESVSRIVRRQYQFFPEHTDLVHCLLRLAVSLTNSTCGEVRLKEFTPDSRGAESVISTCGLSRGPVNEGRPAPGDLYGGASEMLIGGEPEGAETCAEGAETCAEGAETCAGPCAHNTSSIMIPIQYQNAPVGLMTLASSHPGDYSAVDRAAAHMIAGQVARHLKRYEAGQLIRQRFGADLMLIGMSNALERVDEFIEKAAQVDLPILITGEFGTEKEHLACATHLFSRRNRGPFIKLTCAALRPATYKSELPQIFAQAEQGTIFLDGVDELNHELQLQLLEVLKSRGAHCVDSRGGSEPVSARVIASTSTCLNDLIRDDKFFRHLGAELDFLSISIAPLRERREDISPLIGYFLGRYSAGRVVGVAKNVLALFEGYHWPANVLELERVIARLATMSEAMITIEGVRANTPDLLKAPSEPEYETGDRTQLQRLRGAGEDGRAAGRRAASLSALAGGLMRKDPVELKGIHPALQSALAFLVQHFTEDISLPRLSQHACVSGSHLCFLFRKELGSNFKSVLNVFRIEKAKQLLNERANLTTTEVSNEVGFSDPRHYQRVFKQMVGCTTREYKFRQRNAARG